LFCRLARLGVLRDELDGVLASQDLLGNVVGDCEHELLLESHDKLHSVQRVKAQVVNEVASGLDLSFQKGEHRVG